MAVDSARFGGLFAVKSVDAHLEHVRREGRLRRAVGLLDLTALGIGAIIGTGIFVILGEAIGDCRARRSCSPSCSPASPASSRRCPTPSSPRRSRSSGSAYTYAYATMGELVAWIIGWDLILEYGVSVAAVAVGWGGSTFNELLDSLFGITLPDAIASRPGEGRRRQPPGRRSSCSPSPRC